MSSKKWLSYSTYEGLSFKFEWMYVVLRSFGCLKRNSTVLVHNVSTDVTELKTTGKSIKLCTAQIIGKAPFSGSCLGGGQKETVVSTITFTDMNVNHTNKDVRQIIMNTMKRIISAKSLWIFIIWLRGSLTLRIRQVIYSMIYE